MEYDGLSPGQWDHMMGLDRMSSAASRGSSEPNLADLDDSQSYVDVENVDPAYPADQSSEPDTEPLDTTGDSLPDISFDSDVTEFDSDRNIINSHANSIEDDSNQDKLELS